MCFIHIYRASLRKEEVTTSPIGSPISRDLGRSTGWLRSPGMRNAYVQRVVAVSLSRLVCKEVGFCHLSSNPQRLAPAASPQEPCQGWERALPNGFE